MVFPDLATQCLQGDSGQLSTGCSPVSDPQGLCYEYRCLFWAADKRTKNLFLWPGPELLLLGLPCLPELHPVFFLPWARPEPGPEAELFGLFPGPSLGWVGPS